MIQIVVRAYDDERNLVCHLMQNFDNDEQPDWSTISYEVEEQLNNNIEVLDDRSST